METFMSARTAEDPPCFDWTSDGCTASPDSIPGVFGFGDACNRHDFGFQNADHKLRESEQKAIDSNFKDDMDNYCNEKYHKWYKFIQKGACKASALWYYGCVRVYHKVRD
jgi:hypothetical protein